MKINVKNNLPDDVEVQMVQTFDGSVSIIISEAKLSETKSRILGDAKPGEVVKIGDWEWVVLEQRSEGTAVITKDFIETMEFGNNFDWRTSLIREKLNKEFIKELTTVIGERSIIETERDLTSLDGLDDYGTCMDKISLLTATEYAKYHKILGLKSSYPDWWFLITPYSAPSNGYSRGVCCVRPNGAVSWRDCDCALGVRPFCILNSSIPLSD